MIDEVNEENMVKSREENMNGISREVKCSDLDKG
jgi:hypothetical protein